MARIDTLRQRIVEHQSNDIIVEIDVKVVTVLTEEMSQHLSALIATALVSQNKMNALVLKTVYLL